MHGRRDKIRLKRRWKSQFTWTKMNREEEEGKV